MLGVSRQHVVDLCDRGDLEFMKVGSHRRVPRAVVERMLRPALTREQEKSLWLHRALLGPLMRDPREVLQVARENLARGLLQHRADGMAVQYLEQWRSILDDGVDAVITTLTSADARSIELRQNSPFAGVLSDEARRDVLRSFRRCWESEHTAA